MASGEGGVEAATIAALREMRRARRRRYVEEIDLMEALYRIYLGAVFGAIALGVLGGLIHEAPATDQAVEWLRHEGTAVLGAVVAVAVMIGLRTGARGGPLAIEAAEVQYVLMAPLRRSIALRATALRQLRIAALAGLVLGAAAGNFVFRRLPGSPVEWIACLALFCALVPVALLAAASVASGRRWGASAAGLLGLLLVAWSGADIIFASATSPATMLGALATLPLQGGGGVAMASLGTVLVIGLAAIGLLGLGGIRLEAARRRAALAAELRFSAAMQDLRTVVLLRRQLASERPRRHPWLRLASERSTRYPVWRRGWQSFLRWPSARLLRVALIGIVSGVALAAAWRAAPLALFIPGALLFVAALDLIEPLAQESDHPTRRRLLPSSPDWLVRGGLAAPAAATTLVAAIATVSAAIAGGGSTALVVGLLLWVPVGLGLACCAAFSATADPFAYLLTPQIGYAVTAAPPVLAALLVGAPLFAARETQRLGGSPEGAALGAGIFVAVSAAVGAWFLGRRFEQRDAVVG